MVELGVKVAESRVDVLEMVDDEEVELETMDAEEVAFREAERWVGFGVGASRC